MCGLIFCEDRNDAHSLASLTKALWPTAPRLEHRRHPLILIRDQKMAERRKKNAADVAAVVKAAEVVADVAFVIAHQDCDAIEPAHETLSAKISKELVDAGIPNVIPVAPAWEMEAWWFLWPDAVSAVNSKWNKLKRKGNHGMIIDAKETLRRDLRNKTARDYEESDSGRIAEQVRVLGIVAAQTGFSESFRDFSARIEAIQAGATG